MYALLSSVHGAKANRLTAFASNVSNMPKETGARTLAGIYFENIKYCVSYLVLGEAVSW